MTEIPYIIHLMLGLRSGPHSGELPSLSCAIRQEAKLSPG